MITVEKTKEVTAKCIKKYGDISMECLAKDPNRDARWIMIRDFTVFVRTICITIAEHDIMCEYSEDEPFCNCIEECLKEWYVEPSIQYGSYKITNCPNVRTDFIAWPIYLQLCCIFQVFGGDPDGLLKAFVNVKYARFFRGEIDPDDMDCLKKFIKPECGDEVVEIYKEHFGQCYAGAARLRRSYNGVIKFVENQTKRDDDPHRF